MRKRSIVFAALVIVLIAIVVLSLFFTRTKRNFKRAGYNVVVIDIDALRADYLGATSSKENLTPEIDNFTQNAFVFKNAVSASGWTLPSTMSIFTSTYPSKHKVLNKFRQQGGKNVVATLSPKILTIAEVLKNNGYETAAFTGDAGVSKEFGFSRGFDTYFEGQSFAGFEKTVPLALNWLKKNNGKKTFLFLHGYDVHGMYKGPYQKKENDFDRDKYVKLEELSLEKKIKLTDAEVKDLRNWYRNKVRRADKNLSVFFKGLKKQNLLDKTIVIFVSDHGTELYDRGRVHHGFSLYDELIKVPLIIRYPDVEGKTIEEQVRTVDIMPTILDILGIKSKKLAKQAEGTSLLPLLDGQPLKLDAFSETDYRLVSFKRALRTADGSKLIYDLKTGDYELYDLKVDPGETKNIYNKESKKSYELEQKLLNFMYRDYEE